LSAYRAQRLEAWGDVDDITLARFLAGEAGEAESERVRVAMIDYPKVQECVTIIREVTGQTAKAGAGPLPTGTDTIPATGSTRRPFRKRWLGIGGLAVAASLLVACGLSFVAAHRAFVRMGHQTLTGAASHASVARNEELALKSAVKARWQGVRNAVKGGSVDTIRLERKGGAPEVDVTLNGRVTVPFVFDEGASITTISDDLASRIGVKPQSLDRTISVHLGDGAVVEAKQKTIPSVRVGKFTLHDVPCAVVPPEKGDVPPRLGQSFLQHFAYKIEPAADRVLLHMLPTRASGELIPADQY
jgi:clan AA aspartic protease (TIGR02281 family)